MTGLPGRLRGLFGRPGAPPVPDEPPAPQPEQAMPPVIGSDAIACYRLASADGFFLTVAGETPAEMLLASPRLDAAHAAIVLVAEALPNLGLLIAPDIRSFAVGGDAVRGIALAGRLLQTDTRGIVRFKHPLGSDGFLNAAPPPSMAVRFEDAGDTMQAAFTLKPLAATELTAGARALSAEFGGAASEGLRAEPLLARLRTGTLRPELAGPLIRLMPREELDLLAWRALHEPAILARLQRAMPDDTWLSDALPALVAWQAGGRPPVPGHVMASPAAEEATLLPAMRHGVRSAGLALHTLARRHVLPRRTACVLATARNEGPYLLDWISYHLSIGFEHVFLYTNDNDDGSDALLAVLAEHGVITHVHNARTSSVGPQEKAYTHALTLLPQILDYRWTAILDLDEYLAFDTGMFASVTDFIGFQETQPADAVALCWAMFASLPGETWTDEPSMSRFVRRSRDINVHVKSLFRTRMFSYAQPHYPTPTMDAAFHYRTQDGHVHHHPGVQNRIPAFAEAPSAKQAWINHYMLRTADEALWKWSRGRADWAEPDVGGQRAWFLDFVSRTFLDLARPELLVEDRRILTCAPGQGATLDRLLGLPGVAEADATIKARFAEQLARNTASFLARPLPPDAPDTLRHFRDLVADTHA